MVTHRLCSSLTLGFVKNITLQGSMVEIIDLMTDDTDHPDISGMVGLWSYNGSTFDLGFFAPRYFKKLD